MLPADVKLMFWQHSRAHHSWHPYRVYAHTARNSCELRYCKKLNSLYIVWSVYLLSLFVYKR